MPSFRDIKRRIGGVKNIQQITRAMKMVAAARLRRSEEAILALRPFASRLDGLCARLLKGAAASDHPFFEERPVRGVAVLTICSDRGLCGAYNNRVIDRTRRLLEERPGRRHAIIAVGERGISSLQRAGYEIHAARTDVFNPVHFHTAQGIRAELERLFLSREVDEVVAVFTEFFSPMRQEVIVRRLLPCPPQGQWEQLESDQPRRRPDGVYSPAEDMAECQKHVYIYEPAYEALCTELLEDNLNVQIFRALLEAQASEHGARMMAMDNATENADEMIDHLTLEMNRVRQESITSEILDVVGGAEAMK